MKALWRFLKWNINIRLNNLDFVCHYGTKYAPICQFKFLPTTHHLGNQMTRMGLVLFCNKPQASVWNK